MKDLIFICVSILIVGVIFFASMWVFASAATGNVSGYAWGENLGWVNFGCAQCSAELTDSAMTGYAWSDVAGWINFAPTHGGVTHDGNGTLGGTAWSERLGWISFSGALVNTATGRITGTCGSAGATAGRINFGCANCSAVTTWRPPPPTSPPPSGGGGGGGGIPSLFGVQQTVGSTTPEETVLQEAHLPDTSSDAYRYWLSRTVKYTDIVRDGHIDLFDFNSLMVNWARTGDNDADINYDYEVDIYDFNLLMVYWGQSFIGAM